MSRHHSSSDKTWNRRRSSARLTVIGRTFFVLVFLLSLLGGPTPGADAATPITFTAEELLTRPTATSININAVPASTVELYYEYKASGATTYSSTAVVSAAAGQPCNVVISDLSAATQYSYHMKYHLPGESDWVTRSEHSFHTQRAAGETFTFVVTSDTHSSMNAPYFSTAYYDKTLAQIKAEDPDLWIDTGDTPCLDFMDTLQEYQQGYLSFRNLITSVSGDIPIFKALGNHEQAMGWNLDDKTPTSETQPVLAVNAQKAIFPSPKPDGFYTGNTDASLAYLDGDHLREDYYAWTWGDAQFIVLDPYWYTMKFPQEDSTYPFGGEENQSGESATKGTRWDWSLGIDQYLWLKNTLAGSTATYKFIFIHNVTGGIIPYGRGGTEIAGYFEWGGQNWNGTWGWDDERPAAEGWDVPIHQLMDRYNVTIFFHGHDHYYAKQKLNGIVYQEVPMPAADDGYWGFANEQTGTYASQYPDPDDILFYDGAEKYQDSGHLRVTVSPTAGVTVDYVDMNDGSVTASYTIPPPSSEPPVCYALTLDSGANGDDPTAVPSKSDDCASDGLYVADEVIALTAHPAAGYQVAGWNGTDNDASKALTNQVTMSAEARTVTVNYGAIPPNSIQFIGNIGSATSKTSGATVAISTSAAVAAGDDIIIAYATDPNANVSFSLTDSAGNTYSQVGYAVNTGQLRTYIFAAYNVNALPSGSTITINAGVAVTARAAVASVFSGLADADPLDRSSTGTGTGAAPSAGPTSTTSEANELLIGAIGTEGPSGDPAGTWGNSFTTGPRTGTTGGTDDTNITISLGYRIVSATAAYTAAKSGITSRDWAAVIATFKAEPDPNAPRITIAGTPLSAFSSRPGVPSAEQSYTVSGSNLTGDITINAPSDFQISLSSGTGFASSLTLPQSGGSVAETTIYVRFNRVTEGTSGGNITHTSPSAPTRNVAVTGTAAPLSPVAFNVLLGRPEDVSITANVIPDQNSEFYIEYGTAAGVYAHQTATYAATANTPVELVIGSLSADTKYYYRIVYRQSGATEWNNAAEHTFMTQRAAGSTFTFTVTSDNHLGQYGGQTTDELDLWEVTLQNIAGDRPDFHIDTGDTFPMDPSPLGTGMTDAEGKAAYLYERPYLGAVTHSIPYFQAVGNHENEEGWNFDDFFAAPDQSLALAGMKYRKLYYPNPVPDSFYSGNTDTSYGVIGGDANHEDYWAWTWGDALFVVIDPYHYSLAWSSEGDTYGGEGQDGEIQGTRWDWSLGIQQYLWLQSVLENSHAKYKFVFTHHVTGGASVPGTESVYGRGGQSASPFFEWGGRNTDGAWAFDVHRPASDGWTLPIHQLMVKNGVSIFFHGHDHDYARELVDGIVYLECPKPDDAGYTWQPYSYGHNEGLYPNAIKELENSGYFRVNVSPTETKVEYVRSYLSGDGTNGVVADWVTVPGAAPSSYRLMVDKTGPGSGTVTSDLTGINCGSTCSAAFSTGASVTLTATPASGSTFTGWGGDCSGAGTCTLTMDSAHVVRANFSAPGTTYSLTVNAGSNGSVTPAGTSTRNAGDVVSITATPKSGYHFVNWTGNWGMIAHTTGAATTITMNGNYTIQANFAANTSTSYTLTTRATSGGAVTVPASSPASYTSGTVVTLTATPNPGYHFVNWTGLINTVGDTKSASTTAVMNGNYAIQANFTPDSPANIIVDIARAGAGDVALGWQHEVAGVDHYVVYRSLTSPYFTPGANSWLAYLTPSAPPSPVTFPDTGANLTVAGNTYFYTVTPQNASWAAIGSGNRTGAFVFGLVPGVAEP